jgi:two-component system chemotaxis response regulator CheB
MADISSPQDRVIKVLIVEDSMIIRALLRRMLDEQEDVTVVEMAENGKEGIEKAEKTKPDIILLDIEMPIMTGLEALPHLRKIVPNAKIIIVSTLSYAGAEVTLQALEKGAADFIQKPTMKNNLSIEDFTRELISKILVLGKARSTVQMVNPLALPSSLEKKDFPSSAAAARSVPVASPVVISAGQPTITLRKYSLALPPKIFAIGSSTGGPEALTQFFAQLRGKFPWDIPIVVTQHMPAFFTSVFAGHITKASDMPCYEAKNGDILKPRTIYIAPGDYHMVFVREGDAVKVVLNQNPAVNFCRPAVDPMFESLVEIYKGSILAAIFTGMGQDGLNGSRLITEQGGMLIAQDQKSSVVWGMPGAVATAGLCSAVLPLDNMAEYVSTFLSGGKP